MAPAGPLVDRVRRVLAADSFSPGPLFGVRRIFLPWP